MAVGRGAPRLARTSPSRHGRGARSRRLAFSRARLVSPISISAAARSHVRPLADVHRVRRRVRRAERRRRRAIRGVGRDESRDRVADQGAGVRARLRSRRHRQTRARRDGACVRRMARARLRRRDGLHAAHRRKASRLALAVSGGEERDRRRHGLRRTRALGSRRALRARRRLPRRAARAPSRVARCDRRHRRGRDVAGKAYVDTGPILERDLARRAGLGWFGKNTMLINPKRGSFFFLGELLLDLELEPDAPFASDHCGTCRRCIDACPTGAIVERARARFEPLHLVSHDRAQGRDSRREWHAAIGEMMYGCDICQDVCPWNEKFSLPLREHAFRPRGGDRGQGCARRWRARSSAMSDEDFRTAFKGSPMKRAKLRGLKRNAAVVLGNADDGVRQRRRRAATSASP